MFTFTFFIVMLNVNVGTYNNLVISYIVWAFYSIWCLHNCDLCLKNYQITPIYNIIESYDPKKFKYIFKYHPITFSDSTEELCARNFTPILIEKDTNRKNVKFDKLSYLYISSHKLNTWRSNKLRMSVYRKGN